MVADMLFLDIRYIIKIKWLHYYVPLGEHHVRKQLASLCIKKDIFCNMNKSNWTLVICSACHISMYIVIWVVVCETCYLFFVSKKIMWMKNTISQQQYMELDIPGIGLKSWINTVIWLLIVSESTCGYNVGPAPQQVWEQEGSRHVCVGGMKW